MAKASTDTVTKYPPIKLGKDGRMILSPEAKKLYDSVAARWELSEPVEAMLRTACEQRTILEATDAVLAAEGLVVMDMKGSCKAHPLAVLAKDMRAGVSQALQRLLSNLG
jgi:hypothetical protein